MTWLIQIISLVVLFGKIHSDDSDTVVDLVYNTSDPVGGVKETTPVIFLHGITSSKEAWGKLPQVVADTFGRKVYAIDARNHGDSEWSKYFNFDLNAEDFNHFMDTIKVDKAILIGHSMGGITSMKTALKWPHRVEKLIVEDMTARHLPQQVLDHIADYLKLCQAAVKKIPTGTPLEDAEKMVMKFIFNSLPEKAKSMIKPSEDFKLPLKMNPDGSYTFKTNFNELIEKLKDVNGLYPKIKGEPYNGPACFIYGANSPIQVWKDEDIIKGFFPNAKFFSIKGAGHGVHADNPVDFRKALMHCLKN